MKKWSSRIFISLLAAASILISVCLSAYGGESAAADAAQAKDIMILYTSDVHCGIDEGFSYVGLQQVRDTLEAQGYHTILVDDGDAIQGEAVGTITKGEAIIRIMNAIHYDVAIPGNHEFDYGPDHFLQLTRMAEFPYISCNFTLRDELVFPPYVIIEAQGLKIAFVGVTTPMTPASSAPDNFRDEEGNLIYGFMQDETGEKLYAAVQKAVDDARAEGADYVYVMGNLGLEASCSPWTYADVISHTNGIDVFLDGHSHDVEQVVMKNKDGKEVVRSACGTKLESIGYSHISVSDGSIDTNIWSWPNKISTPDLLGIENGLSPVIGEIRDELDGQLQQVIAYTPVELTIYDPIETDLNGQPVRMVRRAETNLGDFVTDAVRTLTGADIALFGGGSFRRSIENGEITFADLMSTLPYSNQICVIEATGQQILDALEWGAKDIPDQFGGFLQVSGLHYEIDASVPGGCKEDDLGLFTGIEGDRRVGNVAVGGAPLDPERIYTVAGTDFMLLRNGDGFTMFNGDKVINSQFGVDIDLVCDYLQNVLNGEISPAYTDIYGEGRIVIISE